MGEYTSRAPSVEALTAEVYHLRMKHQSLRLPLDIQLFKSQGNKKWR
jgi:hypothetical protein